MHCVRFVIIPRQTQFTLLFANSTSTAPSFHFKHSQARPLAPRQIMGPGKPVPPGFFFFFWGTGRLCQIEQQLFLKRIVYILNCKSLMAGFSYFIFSTFCFTVNHVSWNYLSTILLEHLCGSSDSGIWGAGWWGRDLLHYFKGSFSYKGPANRTRWRWPLRGAWYLG